MNIIKLLKPYREHKHDHRQTDNNTIEEEDTGEHPKK